MKLFKTTEGFINLEQEGRSFELTVSRIEDKISEMREARGLDEDDFLVNVDLYEPRFYEICQIDEDEGNELEEFERRRGFKICSIGLGDIGDDYVHSELILFLSDLLKIDQASLSELDYLNLRKF